ncbi:MULTISPECIES: HAMP domain-containing methyl-accepting chemotaxis protein [unclassified Synechocystis]|uniref:methyl-accepting chemotaxis protein n=1 Tax=unclassified Synechocystis TaxID=2640012 RepID=UPI00040927CA|nr:MULTISPECIES: HAMP domain-containing methyl-accepting chemotaxis protein [unclassified Synechocystis]AIE73496.1 methyl-accepting chemotaxis protein (MCP-like) [Synechocystis sp. PCC 6714]MCT0254153.1 HAMP domain-containing protein [Synechocystis sp. CS-94]
MVSTSTKPQFSQEILELQAMATATPDDLFAQIALAGALQEEGFWEEAAQYYHRAQELDSDGIYGETISKALAEIQPNLPAVEENYAIPQSLSEEEKKQAYPPEILMLQETVRERPEDLVAQISFASALEAGGFLTDALQAYEDLKIQDEEGIFHATCDQAIAGIEAQLADPNRIIPAMAWAGTLKYAAATDDLALDEERSNLTLQKRWANLPIATKQFTALLVSSALTVVAVVGTGMMIAISSGRFQLKNQTLAELVVTEGNYNIKINQMGFGFRGQSDNVAIIEAARLYGNRQPIPANLRNQVRGILQNEVKSRNIEYATLVGQDQRIIASANAQRNGQIFDPSDLVTLRLGFPGQIKFSTTISKQELQKESAPNVGQLEQKDALIRYTVTPVRDPQSKANIGTLIAGDIVNGKDAIVQGTVDDFDGGYSAIYYLDPDGALQLATSSLKTGSGQNTQLLKNVPLPDLSLLKQAQENPDEPVVGRLTIDGEPLTLAVKVIKNIQGQPLAFLVRGTSEVEFNQLLERTLLLQMGVGVLALVIAAIIAYWLGQTLTKSLKSLQSTAQKLGEGSTDVRAVVESKDEVGQLALTFNAMAEQVEASTRSLQETSLERQQEAEKQRQLKEELQDGVVRLLTDIEESSRGDLTVRSSVEAGAVGAIADAFNATLAGLRKLVKQVVDTATEVSGQAQEDSQEITSLSDNALEQARALESATASVAEMAQSIESVAKSAQTAAAIARQGNEAAQQGQNTMDETVESIYKVRGRVAEISKKSKRLAESSLEISKIVGIISGISEKTNLLAFNASIEAARAGENGQGFRIVADEVRRLAEMVTLSAQEIEQVILSIQEETSQMSQLMEESTNEVVTGTQLVQKTKETLQNLAQISEEIDTVLDSISRNTESQRLASQMVTETVQNVASVAKATSDKSQLVSQSLQSLAKTAVDLQTAAGKFKVE